MKWTAPMLWQMLAYCDAADEDGWYYGNKTQFCARHDRLVAWLKAEIKRLDAAKSEG